MKSEKIMSFMSIKRVEKEEFVFFTSKKLLKENGIHIIFTTKLKGVSSHPYKSLNLAFHVGDEEKNVNQNRKLLCSALNLNLHHLTTCEQVHGNNVVVIDEDKIGSGAFSRDDTISKTDALITNIRRVPLAIFCADCVPIIIVDPVKRVVGVVHAGWKGTYLEIAKKTVHKFIGNFCSHPQNLIIFIGPSIGSCCYKVDTVLAQMFKEKFILPLDTHQGESYLNLVEINIGQLLESEIKSENIYRSNKCTSCDPAFFSYRKEGGLTGRQCALAVVV